MLLDMKARVEGIRALILKLSVHDDSARALGGTDEKLQHYHQGQVDLLVPLVKSYGSDEAFRVCEEAIQTFGGAGYTRDYPVEQYCRDAKIFSIYEGTNHIQAMDLVGRKLAQAGGANLQAYLADVASFVAANGGHPVLGGEVKRLGLAQEALAGSAMKLLSWFQTGHIDLVPLNANRFLRMMSELTVAWLLLDGAIIAHEAAKSVDAKHPDTAFYAGKVQTALYYARTCLPDVEAGAKAMGDEDRTPLDIPDASFATV
jgi:alkylation response protein AidB-like acyl-CoA dehydrogenase